MSNPDIIALVAYLVCSLLHGFAMYWIGRDSGIRTGRDLQRVDDITAQWANDAKRRDQLGRFKSART